MHIATAIKKNPQKTGHFYIDVDFLTKSFLLCIFATVFFYYQMELPQDIEAPNDKG